LAVEIRRLIVNEDELKQICTDFIASGDSYGLSGTMMDLKIVSDDPFEVSLMVHNTDGQQIPFDMDETHLVTALLGFCSRKGIPVSKSAKKTVKRTETGMIAFDMILQSKV